MSVGRPVKIDYTVVIDMYQRGKSQEQIARKLGNVSRSTVSRAIRRWKEGRLELQ